MRHPGAAPVFLTLFRLQVFLLAPGLMRTQIWSPFSQEDRHGQREQRQPRRSKRLESGLLSTAEHLIDCEWIRAFNVISERSHFPTQDRGRMLCRARGKQGEGLLCHAWRIIWLQPCLSPLCCSLDYCLICHSTRSVCIFFFLAWQGTVQSSVGSLAAVVGLY